LTDVLDDRDHRRDDRRDDRRDQPDLAVVDEPLQACLRAGPIPLRIRGGEAVRERPAEQLDKAATASSGNTSRLWKDSAVFTRFATASPNSGWCR
jgi:hypothetical protein